MRVGMGYDVHRLAEDRKMILGGVEIPYEKGLLGHSDADVLVHAIMDALLGAAALGDIGKHFPDTDPEYKGISSIRLLKHVGGLLDENRYMIENIDATIIAQRPKMRPYIDTMRQNQSDNGGRTWVYRGRRRDFFSGDLCDREIYKLQQYGCLFGLWDVRRMLFAHREERVNDHP